MKIQRFMKNDFIEVMENDIKNVNLSIDEHLSNAIMLFTFAARDLNLEKCDYIESLFPDFQETFKALRKVNGIV